MGDPRIDRIAARQAAQTAATRLTVTPLMADTAKMSDEQVGKLTALFDVFDPDGHAYGRGCRQLRRCPVSGGAGASVAGGLDAGQDPAFGRRCGDEGAAPDPFVQPTGRWTRTASATG